MNDKERVPNGYEVETDMFGFPYLRRKSTDRAPGWAKVVLAILVFAACIKLTIPFLDFLYRFF